MKMLSIFSKVRGKVHCFRKSVVNDNKNLPRHPKACPYYPNPKNCLYSAHKNNATQPATNKSPEETKILEAPAGFEVEAGVEAVLAAEEAEAEVTEREVVRPALVA